MSVSIPTVHLNGTSKNELLEQLANAIVALKAAERALGAAVPNGRDYYVQGPRALKAATEAHRARMIRLGDNIRELEAICEGVMEQ